MATKTYDFKKVGFSLKGVLITGYMDGTGIVVSRDEDSFTKHTGADGEVSRSMNANKGGSITVTLKQTSASNDYLSQCLAADELSGAGSGVAALTDASGRTQANGAEAWVKKSSDVEFAGEITGREWVIDVARLDLFVGGTGA